MFQQPQGEAASLMAAALLQAQLPTFLTSFLPALLPPFSKDVLEGAGVAPEIFGNAEGSHDLVRGKTLKTFLKNRHD
jgi:hypothetical protein